MNSLLIILGTSVAAALFIVLALGVKLRPEKKVIRSPISKGRHSKRASLRARMFRRKPRVSDAVPPVDMHWAIREEEPPATSVASTPEAEKGKERAALLPAGDIVPQPLASSESPGAMEGVAPSKVAAHDRAPAGSSATAQLPLMEEPVQVGVESKATEAVTEEPPAETSPQEPSSNQQPKTKSRAWPSALRPFSSPPPPPVPPPLAPVEAPAPDDTGDQTAKKAQESVAEPVAEPTQQVDGNGPVSGAAELAPKAEPKADSSEGGSVVATPAPETSVLETAKSETEETQKPDVEEPQKSRIDEQAASQAPPLPSAPPGGAPHGAAAPGRSGAPTPSYYDLDMKPPGTQEQDKEPATGTKEAQPAPAQQAQLQDIVAEKPRTIPEPPKESPADQAARAREAEKQRAAISPTKAAYEAAVTITPKPGDQSKPDLLRGDFLEPAKAPRWGGWRRTASRGIAVATTKLLLALMLFSVVLSLIAVFAIKWLGAIMRGLVGT